MANDSNRVRLALVQENTRGTLPGSARMRTIRVTAESLKSDQKYVDSGEIRADRMEADPIGTNLELTGGFETELYYFHNLDPMSALYQSLFYNAWVNTVERDNDGTAASAITSVTNALYNVASGTAFAAGALVYASGFGVSGNNGLKVLTAGSATTATCTGLAAEASPPAAARLKVVGVQGSSGDIAATTSGLSSTTLDFTTLGVAVGQWLKLANFATAADNAFVRITAVAAHAIALDNLPTSWAADAGTGVTINLFFGDRIFNGTTAYPVSVEKAFLAQATPTYMLFGGLVVDKLDVKIDSGAKITQTFDSMGTAFAEATSGAYGASYVAATVTPAMGANQNVGAINAAGANLRSLDPVKSLQISMANSQKAVDAVDALTAIDTTAGAAMVTGSVDVHFMTNDQFVKYIAGTPTSLSGRAQKNGQAIIWTIPRVTYTGDGQPNATAKNDQVVQKLSWRASFDTLTATHISCDRMEYYA